MPNDTEIEIQVQIEKIAPLKKFLRSHAKKIAMVHQVDVYYTPKHRNFIAKKPISEWLRLRDEGGKISINYKNIHYEKDKTSHFRDEYETSAGDIKQLKLIFKALNIKPVVTVDKQRVIYRYKDYEIAIDAIRGLGEYVEIEYRGKVSSKAAAKSITVQMVQFLKDVGVGKIKRNYAGYPYQILFPKEIKIEELT